MKNTTDFGFVAPAQAPGVERVEKPSRKQETDPFAELAQGPAEKSESEQAAEEEAFESLEAEFEVLAALRRRRDETRDEASEASAAYEAQRMRMARALEAQGTRQFKSSRGLGACSRSEQYTAKITDPSTFIDWCKLNHPELLTVSSQTLTKFIRTEFRDKGVPVEEHPPGIETGERVNLTVTLPKTKER